METSLDTKYLVHEVRLPPISHSLSCYSTNYWRPSNAGNWALLSVLCSDQGHTFSGSHLENDFAPIKSAAEEVGNVMVGVSVFWSESRLDDRVQSSWSCGL